MPTIFKRYKEIKAFVIEVDGVLTDGRLPFSENGFTWRQFYRRDIVAIQMALTQKFPILLTSSLPGSTVPPALMGAVDHLDEPDAKYKAERVKAWLNQQGIRTEATAYLGSDIPDLGCMELVGFPACPADAAEEVKQRAICILALKSGAGVARDLIEKTMKLQGKWNVESY